LKAERNAFFLFSSNTSNPRGRIGVFKIEEKISAEFFKVCGIKAG
jgi:hypothetical protein